MGIKIGNIDASYFKVGGSDCSIYLGTIKLYPQNTPSYKFEATYSDSTSYSELCDSSTELTSATTKPSGYVYSAMTNAVIGDCITSLGTDVFRDCSGLTRVNSNVDGVFNIPSGVTTLGDSALRSCVSATTINLPNTVTSIGGNAFRYCLSLTSINIPSGVTSIDIDTFNYCSGITSINIPSGVTSIGGGAFSRCRSLTSIDIPSGVTSIGRNAFYNCYSLTSIDIPDSVTSIGESAFIYCSGLTSCTIGSGVTSIGDSAFEDCSGLRSVTVNATTPPTLGTYAFNTSSFHLAAIFVPLESIGLYRATSGWSTYSNKIKPINTKIYAKYSDSSTYTEQCDDSVTLTTADTRPVGYQYSAMTRAEIGCTVTTIGTDAFRDCSGLTRVNSDVDGVFHIPYGITTIEDSAIRSCVSATNILLPNSITSIGGNAFRYCINLTSINIPYGVTSISEGTFNSCRKLTSIDIHNNVTSIGASGFCNCSAATSINIGSSVTSIGNFAFGRITGVTSVVIPSGVTSIGQTAFRYCSNLSSVTVKATTPPTLGANAFGNTKSNLVIYVPSGSVNTYKSASEWSTYASKIQAIPT